MSKPYNVFIVYARKDAEYLEELLGHLRPMERAGMLKVWCDRKIDWGTKWEEAILRNMNTADIILLMVSSAYYVSSYIHEKELQYALSRHERGDSKIIPIIVRPCNYNVDHIVGALQVLPKDAKPVTDWHNRDNAWLDVVSSIQNIVSRSSDKVKYEDPAIQDSIKSLFRSSSSESGSLLSSSHIKVYRSVTFGLLFIVLFLILRWILEPEPINNTNNTTYGNNSGIFNNAQNLNINFNSNDSTDAK
jgi:hypothetical protein